MILVIIFITIAAVIIETPYLIRKNYKKELLTFAVLLIVGDTLFIMKSLNKEIGNPFDYLSMFYKWFTNLLLKLFKF
ncbi:hypothetical protein M2651_00535 [Clostridium sp. SYSU_GA19001]|uniref:hypothetical protein n=1 Tax=Clostridium caldaquaticum TaxID=2940653 RepID=UPI00207705BB|nr:hypothetical protein [Clostridium caldaquaticum]MCM8709508.1 hypothetical protein [Clostridium caldaquaticum]